MSVARALDAALDHALDHGVGEGPVEVETDGVHAEVDVVDVDRIGVRVRGIRVRRPTDHDVEAVGREWPGRLRDLPDRVVPVEVDPRLGGANLRSDPADRRDDTFMDVEVRGSEARIRRLRAAPGQAREEVEWTTTRDGLERVVDTLAGG